MNAYFKDKVAVVTGAGSGIGRALAAQLARAGAIVRATDLDAAAVESCAGEIRAEGGRAEGRPLDVASAAAVEAEVRDVVAAHGRLDAMFNNAGVLLVGQFQDFTAEQWRRLLDVNLHGVINGARAAYPVMLRQGAGHIVNTSSLSGVVPGVFQVPYVASKFAVVGLSRALRAEAAAGGVRVSVVCPGFVDTGIYRSGDFVRFNRERMLAMQPRWMWVTPDSCARAILRGVRRNRALILIGWDARFSWMLNRLSPSLYQWIVGRVSVGVRRQCFAASEARREEPDYKSNRP